MCYYHCSEYPVNSIIINKPTLQYALFPEIGIKIYPIFELIIPNCHLILLINKETTQKVKKKNRSELGRH